MKIHSNKTNDIIFKSSNMDLGEGKIKVYKIIPIAFWDGSFLFFVHEKEKSIFYTYVTEFESIPTWVNLGFKFRNIESNIEYKEKEDEFDKKKNQMKNNFQKK